MDHYIFEKMPVSKAYFKMSLPLVFGMVISLVYNMVDTYFIAKTQNTSLVAGVSLCAPMFTMMIAFGDICGIGGSSLISRLLGQKSYEKVKHISAFCFLGSLLFGAMVAIILTIFSTPILHVLGANADTMPYAKSYYFWLILGCPAIIYSIVPGNLLRTEGLATDAMIGSVVGAVINIILDPIFIFSLGLGAGGAAIATIISNIIGDFYLTYAVIKKAKNLTMSPKFIAISMDDFKQILMIGIPASITNLMQSLSILLTNRHLVVYGNDKVASLGIALKINMIAMLIVVGFAFGAQPLIGYNYGANNKKRLTQILRFDVIWEFSISLFFVIIAFICAPNIVRIFMEDPTIVEAGSLMLKCVMITSPLISIILVLTTYFQAAGKALPAFVLSVSRQGVVLVFCLTLLSYIFGYMGVLLAQALSDVITLLIGGGLFVFYRNK